MDTVKYILGKPDFIEGVGNIFPVKVKDHDEFNEWSNVLYISDQHFEACEGLKLLDLLIFLEEGKFIKILEQLFSLVTREKVVFVSDGNNYGFLINEKNNINRENYDSIRKIIMKQNLLFEQKIYKDKLVAEWAKKVLEAKGKNGIKITIEDMISTISVFTGRLYDQIAEQTIYQLQMDFKRIMKFEDYKTAVDFKCAGAGEVSIDHYAGWIDIFKSPYDDLFVKSSSLDKFKEL